MGYTCVSGRVINNGTDINAHCLRSNLLRKSGAERANGPGAHKNFVCAQLPFPLFPLPSSFLLFLPPLFPHLLPATAKESVGALKLVSGSRQSADAKRHLVNFGLKECF